MMSASKPQAEMTRKRGRGRPIDVDGLRNAENCVKEYCEEKDPEKRRKMRDFYRKAKRKIRDSKKSKIRSEKMEKDQVYKADQRKLEKEKRGLRRKAQMRASEEDSDVSEYAACEFEEESLRDEVEVSPIGEAHPTTITAERTTVQVPGSGPSVATTCQAAVPEFNSGTAPLAVRNADSPTPLLPDSDVAKEAHSEHPTQSLSPAPPSADCWPSEVEVTEDPWAVPTKNSDMNNSQGHDAGSPALPSTEKTTMGPDAALLACHNVHTPANHSEHSGISAVAHCEHCAPSLSAASGEPIAAAELLLTPPMEEPNGATACQMTDCPIPPLGAESECSVEGHDKHSVAAPCAPSLPVASGTPSEIPNGSLSPAPACYIEETGWRLYNAGHRPESDVDQSGEGEMLPSSYTNFAPFQLPPPPPVPDLPRTGHCSWSFDERLRTLHADFRPKEEENRAIKIDPIDKNFLLMMMERDDLTVISEGLVQGFDWRSEYLKDVLGNTHYSKFREFNRKLVSGERLVATDKPAQAEGHTAEQPPVSEQCYVRHEEKDGFATMRFKDYQAYLEKRKQAINRIVRSRKEAGLPPADFGPATGEDSCGRDHGLETMTYIDNKGEEKTVNVVDCVLYAIDCDFAKLLPVICKKFKKTLQLDDFLPGGDQCMMHAVADGARPFMGPNFYVTPPGAFTHFHQDGHGTVDSGHQSLSGFNEVVMLRRLPEFHKMQAIKILNGKDRRPAGNTKYNALYGLPHCNELGDKPMWPDHVAIEKCRQLNYCPSVFILRPGQLVHINKGRLHAFRKLSPATLPPTDCHCKLRGDLVKSKGLEACQKLCVSVAWDWNFKGITSEGINREVAATIECAELARQNGVESLAIAEHAVLSLAKNAHGELGFEGDAEPNNGPTHEDVLRGILPSLEHIVKKHVDAYDSTMTRMNSDSSHDKLSIAKTADANLDSEIYATNPYGNDYSCKLCSAELPNYYFHCDACEKRCNKDFNICHTCHKERKYAMFVQMHDNSKRRDWNVNHTGSSDKNKSHREFTFRSRFMSIEEEKALLDKVKKAVGDGAVPYSRETVDRLSCVKTLHVDLSSV